MSPPPLPSQELRDTPPKRGLIGLLLDRSAATPARLVLALFVLVYSATVLPHLGDDPIAGGDEGWIISASAKLAEQGVFGSDLFKGFFDADRRYYFNLPLHHLMLAAVFEVFGVGLTQARALSYVFGLAALLLTYALGRRLAGEALGLLSAALLVLLRLNLAPFSGLTLTDLGATVRYDLICVPFGLAALLLLLDGPRPRAVRPPAIQALAPPTPLRAWLAGLLLGLASLTQFIGAFYSLPAALFLLTLSLPRARRLLLTGALAAGLLLPLLPYAAYVSLDWSDFRAQSGTNSQKTELLSPAFYWDEVVNERHRYAIGAGLEDLPRSAGDIVRRPSARLGLLLALPALALMLARGRGDPGRRLIGLTLVSLAVELALFESTKRFVYTVVLVPPLCIALADLALWAWQRRASPQAGRLARAAVVTFLALFFLEGLAVAGGDLRDARDAVSYAGVGRQVEAVVPAGAIVLTDNRLWPALRDEQVRSLLLLFYHTNPQYSKSRATDIFGAFERIDPDYVLLSPLSREILAGLSPRDSADFDRYLETRTRLVTSVSGPPYGPIEVYRVEK